MEPRGRERLYELARYYDAAFSWDKSGEVAALDT